MNVHFKSEKQDWGTPQAFFDRLHAVFDFDIDVCAHEGNAKLPRYWDLTMDGLFQDWTQSRNWCNPPYGKELPIWIEKAVWSSLELRSGCCIVILTPARTDTKWFHKAIQFGASVCFIKGRLKFEGAAHSAPFPSCLLIWGNIPEDAKTLLNEIGVFYP